MTPTLLQRVEDTVPVAQPGSTELVSWDIEGIVVAKSGERIAWSALSIQLSRSRVVRPSGFHHLLRLKPRPVHVLVVELRSSKQRLKLIADTEPELLEGLPRMHASGPVVAYSDALALIETARVAEVMLVTEGESAPEETVQWGGPLVAILGWRWWVALVLALGGIFGSLVPFLESLNGRYVDRPEFWVFLVAPPGLLIPLALGVRRKGLSSVLKVVALLSVGMTLIGLGNAALDGQDSLHKAMYVMGHGLFHPGCWMLTYVLLGAWRADFSRDSIDIRGILWRRTVPWDNRVELRHLLHRREVLLVFGKRERALIQAAIVEPGRVESHIEAARSGSLPPLSLTPTDRGRVYRVVGLVLLAIGGLIAVAYSEQRGLALGGLVALGSLVVLWRARLSRGLPGVQVTEAQGMSKRR